MVLPYSAPSWILSQAENLASSSFSLEEPTLTPTHYPTLAGFDKTIYLSDHEQTLKVAFVLVTFVFSLEFFFFSFSIYRISTKFKGRFVASAVAWSFS